MNESISKEKSLLDQLGLNNAFIRSVKPIARRGAYRAAFNWLSYTGSLQGIMGSELSTSQEVKKYLEGIYHLCKAQDYSACIQILKTSIKFSNSETQELPLHSLLLYKGQARQLLDTVNIILEDLPSNQNEKYFLEVLKAKAFEGLGQRIFAVEIYTKICRNTSSESIEYIEAFARLAGCQVQMGQYNPGIANLEEALNSIQRLNEKLIKPQKILDALEVEILENLAFCAMNKGEFSEAYHLFGEVFHLRQEQNVLLGLIQPLVHQGIILRKKAASKNHLIKLLIVNIFSLLGMRWVSRRLDKLLCDPQREKIDHNYIAAEEFLLRAYHKCEENDDKNSKPWISHHIAWTMINRGRADLAEKPALESLEYYQEVDDKRGVSDCHEQLGRIGLARQEKNLDLIENHLSKSWAIRKDINNFHGTASSTLSLSFLYWHQNKYLKSFMTLFDSIYLFHSIGMLDIARLLGVLTLFSVWTVGRRDWTA